MNVKILLVSWLFIDLQTYTHAYVSDVSKGFFKLWLSYWHEQSCLPAFFPWTVIRASCSHHQGPQAATRKQMAIFWAIHQDYVPFITLHLILLIKIPFRAQNSLKHKTYIYIVSQINYLGQDLSQLTSTRKPVTLVSLYSKRIKNTAIENTGGSNKDLCQELGVHLSLSAALQTEVTAPKIWCESHPQCHFCSLFGSTISLNSFRSLIWLISSHILQK